MFVKEDKVGRDRNNKEQNPGEMLQESSAPRSQREAMEWRGMRKSWRWGGQCIVTKRKVSKTKAHKQRYRHKETKSYSECNAE